LGGKGQGREEEHCPKGVLRTGGREGGGKGKTSGGDMRSTAAWRLSAGMPACRKGW